MDDAAEAGAWSPNTTIQWHTDEEIVDPRWRPQVVTDEERDRWAAMLMEYSELPAEQYIINRNTVTASNMCTLSDGEWLNDAIADQWVEVLQLHLLKQWKVQDAGTESEKIAFKANRVLIWKTQWWQTILKQSTNMSKCEYKTVNRWTMKRKDENGKSMDIFNDVDIMMVPINAGLHWSLGLVNFKKKTIEYYCSLHRKVQAFPECMKQYLKDEWKDKKKNAGQPEVAFDDYEVIWMHETQIDSETGTIPKQDNSDDCGVFAILFAYYISKAHVEGREQPVFENASAWEAEMLFEGKWETEPDAAGRRRLIVHIPPPTNMIREANNFKFPPPPPPPGGGFGHGWNCRPSNASTWVF